MGLKTMLRSWFGGGAPQAQNMLPVTVGMFAGGGRSDSGVNVDEMTALAASSVWCAINVISSAIAGLPVHVVRRDDATKQTEHPIRKILADEPNEYMTAATFRETIMANLLLYGGGYAYIEKDDLGRPVALYPLRSQVTRPMRVNGNLWYITTLGTQVSYLRPDMVLHIPGLTIDGITGLGPIQFAKQSVGLSLALERYAAKFFAGGGNVGGVLTLPPGMSDDAIKNFVASWKKNYAGLDNALKVAALPENYKFTSTTTEPEKAQAIQARVNQVREIARIFRVPLHMMGDLERATFSNIEHQGIEFRQNTIQPWVVKIEQEIDRKLFLEREKPDLQIRFDLDSLLRADTAARYASYSQGRQGGWLSVNDIRIKEGMPPVDGGDDLLQPLNMAPIGGLGLHAPVPMPENDKRFIEQTARRLLTKEAKAVERSAKKCEGKPDAFATWLDEWYERHESFVVSELADAFTGEFAAEHCERSRSEALAAFAAGDIAGLCARWISERPKEVIKI